MTTIRDFYLKAEMKALDDLLKSQNSRTYAKKVFDRQNQQLEKTIQASKNDCHFSLRVRSRNSFTDFQMSRLRQEFFMGSGSVSKNYKSDLEKQFELNRQQITWWFLQRRKIEKEIIQYGAKRNTCDILTRTPEQYWCAVNFRSYLKQQKAQSGNCFCEKHFKTYSIGHVSTRNFLPQKNSGSTSTAISLQQVGNNEITQIAVHNQNFYSRPSNYFGHGYQNTQGHSDQLQHPESNVCDDYQDLNQIAPTFDVHIKTILPYLV